MSPPAIEGSDFLYLFPWDWNLVPWAWNLVPDGLGERKEKAYQRPSGKALGAPLAIPLAAPPAAPPAIPLAIPLATPAPPVCPRGCHPGITQEGHPGDFQGVRFELNRFAI